MQDRSTDKMTVILEGVLYFYGGELSKNKICQILNIDTNTLGILIEVHNKKCSALRMVHDAHTVVLRLSTEISDFIVNKLKSDKKEESLSDASLEVLSIVLYKGEATGSEIEQIRGVNSLYTIRQLCIKGLLIKIKKGMSCSYKPSVKVLSILGITDVEDLPEKDAILAEIIRFEEESAKQTG